MENVCWEFEKAYGFNEFQTCKLRGFLGSLVIKESNGFL